MSAMPFGQMFLTVAIMALTVLAEIAIFVLLGAI
jgi:hypothetical protein